ncbi:MAG: CDP-glycerol glycerophosphotransferase family protein [Pseudomonadota bacterium]
MARVQMRVGFLLNHYAPHQVPHVAPYAFALSLARPGWQVSLLCSSRAEEAFCAEIAALYPGHECRIERLHVPLHARLIDPLVRKVAFYRKLAVQKANIARFASLDALVVPEMTSLSLREDARTAGLKLIFTGHGAGDGYHQAVGMFDPRIDQFDLALLPGIRIAEELLKLGRFANARYAITGYPKFELSGITPDKPLFANDKPTVLFNPTQNRKATCWHKFGVDVLDFFYDSPDYNLIFAPHVLLFQRSWSRGARLPSRYRSTDRVLIDTGSRASVDMTYLKAADLYLGDLSSQIYEFINQPRPCVFLDPFGVEYQGDPAYRSWSFGPVVRDVADLPGALQAALSGFEEYRAIQTEARDRNFAQSETPASRRGAMAIAEFLETGDISDQWH